MCDEENKKNRVNYLYATQEIPVIIPKCRDLNLNPITRDYIIISNGDFNTHYEEIKAQLVAEMPNLEEHIDEIKEVKKKMVEDILDIFDEEEDEDYNPFDDEDEDE